jgi:voltage-gated potassium channel
MRLWPQGPLALFLCLIGALNLLNVFRVSTSFEHSRTLTGLESLGALGGTAQTVIAVMLVIAGTGLLWRIVSAWIVSVMLLVIILVISAARAQWGPSLYLEGIALAALLLTKHRFTRRTVVASVLYSVITILAVLLYGALGAYLVGNGFRPPIQDLSTALYFTIVSLSTVGYGDIVPVSAEARWFAMSLLVVGLSVFATAIVSVVGPKISVELSRLFNPKEKPMEPKDHVILVGHGAIARNTVAELERRHVPFVQIVPTEGAADISGPHVIRGEATSDAVLLQAGVRAARLVIAADEDDAENAFISLGAKELNPSVRVLAVASSGRAMRRLKLARADLVFSPVAVGSRLLADLVQGNQIAEEFHDLLEGLPRTMRP